MKPIKQVIVLFFLISLVNIVNFTLFADSVGDALALGPSKHRYTLDKIEKDQVVRTADGKAVTLEDIVKHNKDTDVFIIGEAHDNYQCHTFQRDFIEALYKKYPKLVVGFEFFRREDNDALEQWRKGGISEDELLKKTGWYKRSGQNYGYTRLIMDITKKYKIKVIGLNVDRSILRKVSRGGFDTLSREEQALFPTIHIPNPQHEYFIKYIFGVFAVQVPGWFANMYSAQKCWDVVMAESMRQTLAKKEYKGYKGVIIAGSNHVSYKLGIPFRYEKAAGKTRLTTIVPILLPKEKKKNGSGEEEEDAHPMMKMMAKSMEPAVIFSRGIADYVFAASQPLDYHFPVIGFSIKEKEGKFEITRVSKKSLAEKNGIRKGDRITAVNGVEITSLEQLRYIIAQKDWDDSISFTIVKKIEIRKGDE